MTRSSSRPPWPVVPGLVATGAVGEGIAWQIVDADPEHHSFRGPEFVRVDGTDRVLRLHRPDRTLWVASGVKGARRAFTLPGAIERVELAADTDLVRLAGIVTDANRALLAGAVAEFERRGAK